MTPTTTPIVMTETEAALQRYLDDHPEDGYARQLLADYLDEIGDPRAAGYRAIGQLGVWSKDDGRDYPGRYWWMSPSRGNHHSLPAPWNQALCDLPGFAWEAPTRRQVENNAALVFDPSFLPD